MDFTSRVIGVGENEIGKKKLSVYISLALIYYFLIFFKFNFWLRVLPWKKKLH